VETNQKTNICQIVSVLVVDDKANPTETTIEEKNGWLYVKSSGNFGKAEG